MQKLEGADDRALVLDGNQLQVLRWGGVQHQFPITEIERGECVRDDKGKTLGVFGSAEKRVRVAFGPVVTAIWLPLERQAEAEAFVAAVDAAAAAGPA